MIEFKLPALGENIEQGDLVRLMIAPGATVSEGQAVMELETDKAVVEVPSSVSGTVHEILVKEGDKIKVGQVVFTAENNGAAAVEAKEPPLREEAAKPAEKGQPAQDLGGFLCCFFCYHGSCREGAAGSRVAERSLSRHRNEHDRPTRQRRASSGCRNLGKTFRRAIWCA